MKEDPPVTQKNERENYGKTATNSAFLKKERTLGSIFKKGECRTVGAKGVRPYKGEGNFHKEKGVRM